MAHNFTPNDLLLYIYNELDGALVSEMKTALLLDDQLSEQYHQMKETLAMLDEAFCAA